MKEIIENEHNYDYKITDSKDLYSENNNSLLLKQRELLINAFIQSLGGNEGYIIQKINYIQPQLEQIDKILFNK